MPIKINITDNDTDIVVKAIIFDDNFNVLMLKRSEYTKKYAKEWDLPGGHTRTKENLKSALKREVYEETGLKLEEFTFFKKEENIHFFVSKYNSEKISLSFEHTEHLFMEKEKLNKNMKFERISLEAIEKYHD